VARRNTPDGVHPAATLPIVLAVLASIVGLCRTEDTANAQTTGEKGMRAPPSFVEYDIRGRRFRVPEKYADSRPRSEALGRVNTTQGQFGFAFWLSDGQPSSVRAVSLTTFWPKEPGRPSSGDSDFVVDAYHVEYLPPGDEAKEVLPSKRLLNTLSHVLPEANRTEDSVYGLICYTSTHQAEHSITCTTPQGSDPEVILSSSWIKRQWPQGGPPNPAWQVEIFSKEDGLWVWLRFPEIALRRWSDVVCQTLTLIRSWQIPPSQSRNGCLGPRTTSNYH
jgi:hypothetical protein